MANQILVDFIAICLVDTARDAFVTMANIWIWTVIILKTRNTNPLLQITMTAVITFIRIMTRFQAFLILANAEIFAVFGLDAIDAEAIGVAPLGAMTVTVLATLWDASASYQAAHRELRIIAMNVEITLNTSSVLAQPRSRCLTIPMLFTWLKTYSMVRITNASVWTRSGLRIALFAMTMDLDAIANGALVIFATGIGTSLAKNADVFAESGAMIIMLALLAIPGFQITNRSVFFALAILISQAWSLASKVFTD